MFVCSVYFFSVQLFISLFAIHLRTFIFSLHRVVCCCLFLRPKPTLQGAISAHGLIHACAKPFSGSSGQSLQSSFHGVSLQCRPSKPIHSKPCCSWSSSVQVVMMAKPAIQFIQGTDEQTIPDVRLTKSRDGTNGVAIFTFEQPSVFDSSAELGDITGFYMIDEEGVLQSVDVSAKFVNGKPARIEAKYVMRTPREWDRFMRFMERYSQANGLQFVRK